MKRSKKQSKISKIFVIGLSLVAIVVILVALIYFSRSAETESTDTSTSIGETSTKIGDIILQPEEEFQFDQKCVVYQSGFGWWNGSEAQISKDIECSGTLNKDGDVTVSIYDHKNPDQQVYVYPEHYDGLTMCYMTDAQLEEVRKMPYASYQADWCNNQSLYSPSFAKIENLSQDSVFLKFNHNPNVHTVSKDDRGYFNMYTATFHIGERVDIFDPDGGINETARSIVANDPSCELADLSHTYNCGVQAVFLAIPK